MSGLRCVSNSVQWQSEHRIHKLESLSVIVKEIVVECAGEVTRLKRVDLSEQAYKHHTIVSTRLPEPSIRKAIRSMESD